MHSDPEVEAPVVVLIQAAGESMIRDSVKRLYGMPPMGLLSIAAFLRMHGYRVTILDLVTRDLNPADFEKAFASLPRWPRAVGFSMFTETADTAVELARQVRALLPGTPIIAGGPHATFCDAELLATGAFDFVIRGEGESALLHLLEHVAAPGLPLQTIPGLSYRLSDGTVVSTPDRKYAQTLDLLPFPAYDQWEGEYRRDTFYVVSSRGCPGRCLFCASTALSGAQYRMHSAEWLFSLVYQWHLAIGFAWLDIMDDTFTANAGRSRRFCQLLRSSGLRLGMRVKSRVDFIREDLVRTLAEAGCKAIHIGVESADDEVLKQVKGTSVRQVLTAVGIIARQGIRCDATFMLGHHCDTLETLDKTVILACVLRDFGVSAVAISTPYPGTRLYREADRLGLNIAVRKWRSYNTFTAIYSTENFGLNDLRRAFFLFEHGGEHIRNKPLLTGNRYQEYWNELETWATAVKAAVAQVAGGVTHE